MPISLTKPHPVVYCCTVQRHGGMAEWTMATVLKTVVAIKPPWVRIPLPPPESQTVDCGSGSTRGATGTLERCQSGRLGLPAKQLWG